MNEAETALRAVLKVIQDYLPPGGGTEHEAMNKIIAIVDPWPLASASAQVAPAGQIEVTPEMIQAAEGVEDLYKRGTPNTWAKVYRAMHAERPLASTPPPQPAQGLTDGERYRGLRDNHFIPAPVQPASYHYSTPGAVDDAVDAAILAASRTTPTPTGEKA